MNVRKSSKSMVLSAVTAMSLLYAAAGMAGETTTQFEGVKVNGGTATHEVRGGVDTLTWSEDFRIPDSPAPHWQVIDSKGRVYLLQRLKIKGDKENRTISLPAYVSDVSRVQIYCAWAEALLGEAVFATPVVTVSGARTVADRRTAGE
jgi:hypothetical protein